MLKITIKKNGVVIPSVTVTSQDPERGQGVLFTKFEEGVMFTSNDRMTIEHTWTVE